MLGSCTYGAANMAASYNGGGKSDWFLPSKDERDALYLQQVTVGGFVAGNYWSSSEYTAGLAYFQIFGTGFQNANNKTNAFYVRPIRAF
jgi:hypothetical protein